MWRPEGWENLYIKLQEMVGEWEKPTTNDAIAIYEQLVKGTLGPMEVPTPESVAYEAGADAMLLVLRASVPPVGIGKINRSNYINGGA